MCFDTQTADLANGSGIEAAGNAGWDSKADSSMSGHITQSLQNERSLAAKAVFDVEVLMP